MGGVIYMKEKIIAFVKKETVLVVAAILAVISAFFVHPKGTELKLKILYPFCRKAFGNVPPFLISIKNYFLVRFPTFNFIERVYGLGKL